MKLQPLLEAARAPATVDPAKFVLLEVSPWLGTGFIVSSLIDDHGIPALLSNNVAQARPDISHQRIVVRKADAAKVLRLINGGKFDTKFDQPRAERVPVKWYGHYEAPYDGWPESR